MEKPAVSATDRPRTHPFAAYVRTLARGPGLSRSLTREEARDAMRLILAGEVEPEQLGAFLMLMRYRGESAEELAGLVEAARDTIRILANAPPVDLDWPSYADRHKQLPWFALAALLLAENGIKVLMHGIAGESEGFVPTRAVLAKLGIPVSPNLEAAGCHLGMTGFAYVGLEALSPRLDELIALRPLLGLRSPVHSLARELNPLRAPCQIQGVFHPNYRTLHQQAAALLGQPQAAIFKGGGGEAQRNPDKPCIVARVDGGRTTEEEWPALPDGQGFRPREEPLDPERVAAFWQGRTNDLPGPVAAITGTVAIALKMLGRADSMNEAQALADRMWRERRAASVQPAAAVA
jgi:anthranilate phosphoribosyltransferase